MFLTIIQVMPHLKTDKRLTIFRIKALTFCLLIMIIHSCTSKMGKNEDSSVTVDKTVTSGHKELRKVTFLPYWVTGAQFAGYFIGVEKGIYQKYGIQLDIIQFQPFVTSSDLLKEGKADFAALWLVNAIEMKALGADIVNIAQPSSRSSLMLVTKKKSGIDKLEKMNGKKLGIWNGFELQPRALFNKYNLDVKIIPIGSTNNLFLMDGVEITAANWFDEYHSIINSGLNPDELNTFFFADFGLNFLEDGIYCLSGLLKKDPQLCADFVNATLEGWLYAFNNPDETIDIIMKITKEAKLPVNKVHQQWMLDRYRDLYFPKDKNGFNTNLSKADYDFVANVLKEGKLIKEIPSFSSFYQPVIKP